MDKIKKLRIKASIGVLLLIFGFISKVFWLAFIGFLLVSDAISSSSEVDPKKDNKKLQKNIEDIAHVCSSTNALDKKEDSSYRCKVRELLVDKLREIASVYLTREFRANVKNDDKLRKKFVNLLNELRHTVSNNEEILFYQNVSETMATMINFADSLKPSVAVDGVAENIAWASRLDNVTTDLQKLDKAIAEKNPYSSSDILASLDVADAEPIYKKVSKKFADYIEQIKDAQIKKELMDLLPLIEKINAFSIENKDYLAKTKGVYDKYLPSLNTLAEKWIGIEENEEFIEAKTKTEIKNNFIKVLDTSEDAFRQIISEIYSTDTFDMSVEVGTLDKLLELDGFAQTQT